MKLALRPSHLFFLILSGWVNRRQQGIIDFQNAQIKALMAKQGENQILLTDDQRRILAVKGKSVGRKARCIVSALRSQSSVPATNTPAPRFAPPPDSGRLRAQTVPDLVSLLVADAAAFEIVTYVSEVAAHVCRVCGGPVFVVNKRH